MDRDITKFPGYRKGRTCACCSVAIGDRGPDSRSGKYYCSRGSCRAVRDRERQSERRQPSWRRTALTVSIEINAERQRDAPKVAELRRAGMTDPQIRREFPELRL